MIFENFQRFYAATIRPASVIFRCDDNHSIHNELGKEDLILGVHCLLSNFGSGQMLEHGGLG